MFTLHGATLGDFVQFAIIVTADGVGASDLEGYGGSVLLSFGGPSLGLSPGSTPFAQRLFQAGVNGLPVFTDFPIHLFAAANAIMPVDVPFQLDTTWIYRTPRV